MKDSKLLQDFIATASRVADLQYFPDLNPQAAQLHSHIKADWLYWAPRREITPAVALDQLYENLPGRFPRLFERLLLSYRWADLEIGPLRLLPNPPGPGLLGFAAEILRDSALCETLLPAGYLQFGRASDVNYDPVCFHLRGSHRVDHPIVQLDHEAILCNSKIRLVVQLAPSFRALVQSVIGQT